MPKSSSKDDSLNREGFEKLWHTAREGDELDRLVFVLCGHLGMRASEVAHLRKDWIDFQRRTVNIPKRDGEWSVKTEASARSIPYGPMRARVGKEIESYFDYHRKVGVTRGSIWYRVKRMGKRSDLAKKVYPHSLRATAAFQFAEAGINAQGLRQIMGWQQLNTAQSYIRQAGRAAEEQLRRIREDLW